MRAEPLYSFLKTLSHGVEIVNTNGVIEFCNEAFLKMSGYEKRDLIGRSFFKVLIDAPDRQRQEARFQALLTNQNKTDPWNVAVKTKAGSLKEVQIDWSPRRDADGRVTGCIAVIIDISKWRRRQTQLEKAHNYLEMLVIELRQKLFKTGAALESKQTELTKIQKLLEQFDHKLATSNHAIALLAQEMTRNDLKDEENNGRTVTSERMPLVDQLKTIEGGPDTRALANAIKSQRITVASAQEKLDATRYRLSPAELKVAKLISAGMTTPTIAEKLFIAEETVKTHRRNIRRKLGLRNVRIKLKSYLAPQKPSG